jgi:hypothetical protein
MIKTLALTIAAFFLICLTCAAQSVSIKSNQKQHTVLFNNGRLKFELNYDHQCRISNMEVNGEPVINSSKGIYSEITTADKTFSTLTLAASPSVKIAGNASLSKNSCSFSNINQFKFHAGRSK